MEEMWRAVPGWIGFYEVSDRGNVRSCDRTLNHKKSGRVHYTGRPLQPGWATGYAMVTLVETGKGRRTSRYIHDLVLEAFIGPKPIGEEVCHGPEGPQTNCLTNLRYGSRSSNALDRHLFGQGWPKKGQLPPVMMTCCICKMVFPTRRRKEKTHSRVCSNPECFAEIGRISMQKKKEKRTWSK